MLAFVLCKSGMLTLISASLFISSHFITYRIHLELGINCMNNTDNNNEMLPFPHSMTVLLVGVPVYEEFVH